MYLRPLRRRDGGAVGDVVAAARQLDRAGRRRGARGGALGDGHARGAGGGRRHRQARPLSRRLREPRAQTQDRGVCDDSDPGAGGVGGLAADGAQAAVVLHRGGAGAAGAAQAHPAALPAAAAPLQADQARGPRQLGLPAPLGSKTGAGASLHTARNNTYNTFFSIFTYIFILRMK